MVGIMDVLRWLKEKYPEKVIPSTITLTTLKDRLVKMSRAGIIRYFMKLLNIRKILRGLIMLYRLKNIS